MIHRHTRDRGFAPYRRSSAFGARPVGTPGHNPASITRQQRDTVLRGVKSRARRLGLTLGEASVQIGVSPNYFYLWSSGDKRPTSETLKKIADWLRNTKPKTQEVTP